MKALKLIVEQAPDGQGVRRSTGLVTRTNFTDLEASALRDWLELTEAASSTRSGSSTGRARESCSEVKLEDGTRVEADVYFLGLDDPDGVNKVRGMPLTWAWLKRSARTFPSADHDDLRALRPLPAHGRWRPDLARNVRRHEHALLGHWLYEFAENKHPEGWAFFKQPGGLVKVDGHWVENPAAENLANLPPGYYLDKTHGASEDWINVFLAANYGFARTGSRFTLSIPIVPTAKPLIFHVERYSLGPALTSAIRQRR